MGRGFRAFSRYRIGLQSLNWGLELPRVDAMKENIQTLGWWMRRTTGITMERIAPFYENAIGLPRVRGYGDYLILVWAGEDLIFEVKTDNHPARDGSDPASAACIPVFRTHDMAKTKARMKSHGYRPALETVEKWGSTSFYVGPDKLVTGFEQRSEDSPLAADRKALKAWREGPAPLGDLPSLPDGLHYLSRVIRRVENVAEVGTYYRDVLGFEEQGSDEGSLLFSLGDMTTLEVAPGGIKQPEPEDREALPDSYILRIHNFDDVTAALSARGAKYNGKLIVWEGGTRLRYLADPEGLLTGIEERGIDVQYLEDIEADKRWKALRAARSE